MEEQDFPAAQEVHFWLAWKRHLHETEARERYAARTSLILRLILVGVLWGVVVWPVLGRPVLTAILMLVFVMSQVAAERRFR